MKTLTVKQPWASLIVEGIKDIENRTWKCPEKYIGQRVLIHAGIDQKLDKMPLDGVFSKGQLNKLMERYTEYELCKRSNQFGSIIGSVEIIGCKINHPSIWAEKCEPLYKFGTNRIIEATYNWILANPIKFPEPIPCKGKLSFWDYPNILAEPEEKGGKLFCHCQLPVKLENQVMPLGDGHYECRYCGGIWYR